MTGSDDPRGRAAPGDDARAVDRDGAGSTDRGATAPDLDAVGAAVDTAPSPPTPVDPAPSATPVNPAPSATPVTDAPSLPAPALFAPPRFESPSADVAVAESSRIPGAVRDGYHQLPTAPVITATSGPEEGEVSEWEPPAASPAPATRSYVAPWALGLAIAALAASIFVGFLFPVGLAAVVVAIIALRRPDESRAVAVWALVLGALAVVYSAGWLWWALPQLPGG